MNICSFTTTKSDCLNTKCENDGLCSEEQGSPICKCNNDFYGQYCQYDTTAYESMKASLNTKLDSLTKFDPSTAFSSQQLNEIHTISNLIKNIPELATKSLNDRITNLAYQQIQSIIKGTISFQNYTFLLMDLSLGIQNSM